MKYWDLLEKGRKALKSSGVTEWEADAFILFEHATGLNRADYLMKKSDEAPEEAAEDYLSVISRRTDGTPVQYITGSASFMGLDFNVNEHVLIPRFDTEILVETVLSKLPGSGEVDILDMCTLCAAERDGVENPIKKLGIPDFIKGRKALIFDDIEPLTVSSTEIRDKIRAGEDVSGLLDSRVYQYILEGGIYRG